MENGSALIASKMLEGWALINEHCPRCCTPLVRNKQRKMFCVSCNEWVLTQAEAAEMTANAAPNPAPAGPNPVPKPTPAPSSNANSKECSTVLKNTSMTLIQKVEETRAVIASTENLADLQESLQILSLCLDCLVKLESCMPPP